MDLKNIFKRKKEKQQEREVDFNKKYVLGTTSSGYIEFGYKINEEIINLYKDNKKDEVIRYCNNIYEKIYINSNADEKCRKYAQRLCNAIILEALKNRKTETSNVICIAINALKDVNVKKEKIYEELSNMNDYERTEIINEAILLLLALISV
ncbi:hypothetical protein [Clostridium baratii]|uniref:hypothetical protein n=1 Tax=Clostridium baratii TaxID=1561 RepID=UPI0030CE0C08